LFPAKPFKKSALVSSVMRYGLKYVVFFCYL